MPARRIAVLRSLTIALASIAASLLCAACTDRKDGASAEQKDIERAVYRHLFGGEAGEPNRLARNEVDRFAAGSVFIKTLSRYRSNDRDQHARIVEAVFSFVGIRVVDCAQETANCPPLHQSIALSLKDDANGNLNVLANELAFRAGKLHVSSDAQRKEGDKPLFSRHLGNTCVGTFAYSKSSSGGRIVGGLILNIEPEGATRLQCTAEKALFLLGLYPTPELVSAASQIVEKISARSHVDRTILPDDAERALDLLYSARVSDSLRASDVPAVLSNLD